MTAVAWGVCLLFGVLVGTASGLLGIGGGTLLVPFLYTVVAAGSWAGVVIDPSMGVVVAHATSLVVTLPTAISGMFAYRTTGLAHWRIVVWMGTGAALGAAAGARVAPHLAPALLQGLFGALLLIAALRMFVKSTTAAPPSQDRDRWVSLLGFGLGIGFFAALLGVGGGIFAIPVLVYFTRLELPRVAATSLGIVVFASASGSLVYLLSAEAVSGDAATVGLILVPAALALIPGAVLGAWVGAALNRRVSGDNLRFVFAVLFAVLGLRYLLQNASMLLG